MGSREIRRLRTAKSERFKWDSAPPSTLGSSKLSSSVSETRTFTRLPLSAETGL